MLPRKARRHQGAAFLGKEDPEKPATRLAADAVVIPANRTRHGPRTAWGKRQFVQGAILAIGVPSPAIMTRAMVSKLYRKVKTLLANNPDFEAAGFDTVGDFVSRRTVANELKKLQRTS